MPSVLITGASTGIGRASALRLAAAGWTVLAGVRDPDAGASLLAQASAGSVIALTLDVTDPQRIAAARERVEHSREGQARRAASMRSSTTPGSVSAGRSS